jgi:hypothetical protein
LLLLWIQKEKVEEMVECPHEYLVVEEMEEEHCCGNEVHDEVMKRLCFLLFSIAATVTMLENSQFVPLLFLLLVASDHHASFCQTMFTVMFLSPELAQSHHH